MEIVLDEKAMLPVTDVHGRAEGGVKSNLVRWKSEQKTRERIRVVARINHQAPHVAATTHKAIGDVVVNQVETCANAVAGGDPGYRVANRNQFVVPRPVGAAAATRQNRVGAILDLDLTVRVEGELPHHRAISIQIRLLEPDGLQEIDCPLRIVHITVLIVDASASFTDQPWIEYVGV